MRVLVLVFDLITTLLDIYICLPTLRTASVFFAYPAVKEIDNIVSDIELIRMDQINDAYERMLKGDVRYRFAIDMKTL
jgi:hypothetical protein